MYRKHLWIDGNESTVSIMRIEDNALIPFVEGNSDYAEYLSWLAEGNEPEELSTDAD